MRYAPKYAPCRPPALAAVMFSEFWNLALRTSKRPYAKPQRKKRMVTSVMGIIDCLTVRAEAPVRPLLEILLRYC